MLSESCILRRDDIAGARSAPSEADRQRLGDFSRLAGEPAMARPHSSESDSSGEAEQ
jgi:hypothetical protein